MMKKVISFGLVVACASSLVLAEPDEAFIAEAQAVEKNQSFVTNQKALTLVAVGAALAAGCIFGGVLVKGLFENKAKKLVKSALKTGKIATKLTAKEWLEVADLIQEKGNETLEKLNKMTPEEYKKEITGYLEKINETLEEFNNISPEELKIACEKIHKHNEKYEAFKRTIHERFINNEESFSDIQSKIEKTLHNLQAILATN